MNFNDFQRQVATADKFKCLMDQMKSETEKNQKLKLSTQLSETLMMPGGFTSYYDYISSITEDQIECISVFCKVVLTRSLKFSDDLDYLRHSTENFSEIIQLFLDKKDDQSLRILLTKLFYFLRRNQNEYFFDFFFESMHANSSDSDALLYIKLCEWQFYTEDLLQIYSQYFKKYIYRFLSTDSPSISIKKALYSGGLILNFISIYNSFEGIEATGISKVLNIWDESIPNPVLESALAVFFPDSKLLHYLNSDKNISFSEEFKDIINTKAKTARYDKALWSQVFEVQNYEINSVSSSITCFDEFVENIRSQEPTNISFGLFNIRKSIESNSQIRIDKNVIDLILSLLTHHDSYVYMNSIKTCVLIGTKTPSLVCEPLVQLMEISDPSLIPRYLEIFNELLPFFKNHVVFSAWTKSASISCSKFSNDSQLEIRCAVINFYINILTNDPDSFLFNQERIWNSFDLSHKNISEVNIDTEVFFQFIDVFLTLIIEKGRIKAKDSVLIELFDFLKRSNKSDSPQVSIMAYNNLALLEKIKGQY